MSTTLETPCSAAPPGENDLDLILNQIWLGDSDRLCQARQIRERVQASWRLEAESAGVETRLTPSPSPTAERQGTLRCLLCLQRATHMQPQARRYICSTRITSQQLGVERRSTGKDQGLLTCVQNPAEHMADGGLPANVNLMRVNGDGRSRCSVQQLAALLLQVFVAIPRGLSLRPAFGGVFQKLPAGRPLIRGSRPPRLKQDLDPGRVDAAPPEHGQGSTLPCSIALGIASTTDPSNSI